MAGALWVGVSASGSAGAAEGGSCGQGLDKDNRLVDQSKVLETTPVPDANGNVYPLVTIHGITGSNEDFEDPVDLTYSGTAPSSALTLLEHLTGKPGSLADASFRHVHVYSYEYTKNSLRWVTDERVGGDFGKVIDCLFAAHGVPVSVLAHSMGGLVTRWVANSNDPQGQPRAPKLGKVVTLGTPYQGSQVAAGAGGALDLVGLVTLPVGMLLIACGLLGTGNGKANCGPIPLLQSGSSEAGRALRALVGNTGSLARWPDSVDVVALAGSTFLEAKLFWATLFAVEVGDLVVGRGSATADADRTKIVECRYDRTTPIWQDGVVKTIWTLTPLGRALHVADFLTSQPCYHGNLMRNWDLLPEILGSFTDWFAASGAVGGFDVRSAMVPSLCGHSAGRLVDGNLPVNLLDNSLDDLDDSTPGYVILVLNTSNRPVSADIDLDGSAETVAVLLCTGSFVGVPPQPDTFLVVFGADGSVRAMLSLGFVDVTSLSLDGGEITLGLITCDPEVRGCRPIGVGESMLVYRDGEYLLKPLDDGRQDLMEGDRGDDVRKLQQALVERGYDIEVDGRFGPGTAAAVRAFQQSALLEATGEADLSTLGALGLGDFGLVADFSSIEEWSAALIRYLTYGEQGRLPSAVVKGLSGFVYDTRDAVPFERLTAEPRSDGQTLLSLTGQDARGFGPALILDVCITAAPALDWCGLWSAAGD